MASYLLSITLCFSIFLLLFLLFFKSDTRFNFNRYYLILTFVFSLALPILPWPSIESQGTVLDLHGGITAGGQVITGFIDTLPAKAKTDIFSINATQVITAIWIFGTLLMALRFISNLKKVLFLVKKRAHNTIQGVHFIYSSAIQQPFTFLRTVFLPKEESPMAIILHEEAHARKLHSIDLMIIEFALLIFWFHPLVWLYRKFIVQNHEFEADQLSLESLPSGEKDLNGYSKLILSYASRQTNSSLMGSPFSYFFIKNRIVMLSKNRNSATLFNLGKTISAIAILAVIFSFMNIESQPQLFQATSGNYKVVIDLGHGGKDEGTSIEKPGTLTEKDLLLKLSKTLKKEAESRKIEVYFTRNSDQYVSLKDRVKMSNELAPNLLVSLHVNTHENPEVSGTEIYYHGQQNKMLAENFSADFTFRGKAISTIKEVNYFILKGSNSPAVMIEMGFISNEGDYNYLSEESNYEEMAKNIFNGIESVLNK